MAYVIAIPTEKGGLDDVVASRFGRAPTFTIVEVGEDGEVKSVRVIQNPGYASGSGAGVKAAQAVADAGARYYIGPSPGPNAFAALQHLGIKILGTVVGVPVKEAVRKAVEAIKAGQGQ